MADLPEPGPTEADFRDHIDTLDDLSAPNPAFIEQQIEHEDESREAIDILTGLREIRMADPVRWAIERIEGDGEPGMLAKWPTIKLKWENIRDEFGPGVYAIEGRTIRGKYVRRVTITIASDAPRKPKYNTDMQAFNVTEFLAQQEARDRATRQEHEARERERQEREDKRAEKREQLLVAAMPALATVLAGFFNRPQLDVGALAAAMRPPAPPDPLQMIAALKQLAPEQPKPTTDPMATAIQLFELLADKAGAGQGRADWLDIVKEGVKVLGPSVGGAIEATITQARENAQASVATGASAGSSNGVASQPALPAPSAQLQHHAQEAGMLDLLPHLPWLKGQLADLASAAARNRDPELYAAMFLEKLPAGLSAQRVQELLSRADWLDQLARFEPQIVDATVPWWQRLQQLILAMIRESQAPPTKQTPAQVVRPQGVPSLTGEPE